MNISKEKNGELNAVIKVKIGPADYEQKVSEILRGYKKKASMPGFRPGMVPFGMIKKMYGKAVMAEEINKILVDSLYKYISEEKLDILGNPLPAENEQPVDFEVESEFEFSYDLGLAPDFEVALNEKEKFTRYGILINDEVIDKNINDVAKRYGKVSEGEVSAESDMLQGEFVELGKENGIRHTATISLEFTEDEKTKKALIGKKIGDTIALDPKKVSKGDADLAAMLGITKKDLENVGSKFEFTISKIYKIAPAEINQDLFNKLFGEGAVNSVEEFRVKVKEAIVKAFENDSERKLEKDISDALLQKYKLNLPDEFLKRWLLAINKDKVTPEQIEAEYAEYADGLRWQLIENKVIKAQDIKVTHDEAVEQAMDALRTQFRQYGAGDLGDELLRSYAPKLLEKEEEARRIYQEIFSRKVMNLMKNTFTIKNKEVSLDEFTNLVTGKTSKLNNLFNKFKF